jgi:hypothetical protein
LARAGSERPRYWRLEVDPYLGPQGAWRVQDQNSNDIGVMKWDPYLAPNGGWRYQPQ